jgi:hypothetical protein
MDASTSTKIRIGRTVFSNVLTKQNMINNGSYISAATLTAGGAGSNETPLAQYTGAVDTSPSEFDSLNGFVFQPPPVSVSSGSYNFPNDPNPYGYLSIANSPDFTFGTGDFTIEWYQYLQTPNSFPRIFSLGSYSDGVTMAVSIEGGAFYFWMNQSPLFGVNVSTLDTWTHFAIVRNSGVVNVYQNGNPIGDPITNATNMIDTIHNLVIGNESAPSSEAAFTGYLTNFRMVKGTAVYLTNFTPPSAPLQAITGTVLLLSALNPASITVDSSSSRKSIINTNVTWSGVTVYSS